MQNIWRIVSHPDNIPILLLLLSMVFFYAIAIRRMIAFDRGNDVDERDKDMVLTYPYLLRIEFLIAIAVIIVLIVWSITIDAPLEEEANPSLTPNPAKAPWYFVGLQEMLVYFDPWIAGVMLPVLIIIGLMVIPYLDFNTRAIGAYSFRHRKLAVMIFSFGFFLWVLLIAIGTFCRGPGWLWFWPWQQWNPHKVMIETNINWSQLFGITGKASSSVFGGLTVLLYYSAWWIAPYLWVKKKQGKFIENLGHMRYALFIFLLASMAGLPVKMFLRLCFNVKYVWTTPWFNI